MSYVEIIFDFIIIAFAAIYYGIKWTLTEVYVLFVYAVAILMFISRGAIFGAIEGAKYGYDEIRTAYSIRIKKIREINYKDQY